MTRRRTKLARRVLVWALGVLLGVSFAAWAFSAFQGRFPFWIPALLAIVGIVAAWYVGRGERKATWRIGHCPDCGYDLTGITGPCPECGQEREA